jgi:alpha-tubulin suppressor-like RCC1 family protein
MHTNPLQRWLLILALCGVAACDGTPTGLADAAKLEKASDSVVEDTVDARLREPLRVRVVDSKGRGVRRVEVKWNTTKGYVEFSSVMTDADGYAETYWHLGPSAGPAVASARTDRHEPVQFHATVLPGEPTTLTLAAVPPTLRRGATVNLAPIPRDRHGNRIGADRVQWESSDSKVAYVGDNGGLEAVRRGSALITALAGAVRESFAVTVEQVTWKQATVGSYFTCGIVDDGTPYCWGGTLQGTWGVLGNGSTANSPRPTTVSGGHRFSAMAAGNEFACGLDLEGRLWCWGAVMFLTDESAPPGGVVPVRTMPDVTFASISAGRGHVCGLTVDGAAYCSGMNREGEIGDGTTLTRNRATPPAGDLRFQRLWAGVDNTCGLTTANEVYCWGSNYLGQLGTGEATESLHWPVQVPWRSSLVFQTPARFHACGLEGGGEAFCWGGNGGKLGDGQTAISPKPVRVMGGHAFSQMAIGTSHTCALTGEGRAFCWGSNGAGTLGDGTDVDRLQPQAVATELRFSSLVAGEGEHTCGLTRASDHGEAGELHCWGYNGVGGVGDGSAGNYRFAPSWVVEPG